MIIYIIVFFIICCLCLKKKVVIEHYICNLPIFNPNKWNIKKNSIQEYNNCYAYAMRNLELDRDDKIQPGDLSNTPRIDKSKYNCENFRHNIKQDYPLMYDTNYEDSCACNYYKIALFLDDKKPDKDYHFYRQDEDMTWSHKPGNTKATNTDESGNIILNPLDCDRNFKNNQNRNYNRFCGYYCVPYQQNKNL